MLLMKLQVLSLELNTSLEESSTQVLSNIPRAVREIERVRKEAVVLKQRLDEFETRLCQAEEGTETSLRLLSELDRVKTKMEFCCEALKEAEKLSKMTGGMEEVFSSGDFAKIAEQIEDMQKSLKVLNHLPEYQQTKCNLQLLQDRLEGSLSSFSSHSSFSFSFSHSLPTPAPALSFLFFHLLGLTHSLLAEPSSSISSSFSFIF
jgi:cell fate (sporulation/competence/biofilm development) regulator YmcA (YheA/YmcA/DUF963 family)